MIIPTLVASLICSKWLVADDPWPFAEEPTELLVEMYKLKPSEELRKELEFRLGKNFELRE